MLSSTAMPWSSFCLTDFDDITADALVCAAVVSSPCPIVNVVLLDTIALHQCRFTNA